jgi:hypothetical protein
LSSFHGGNTSGARALGLTQIQSSSARRAWTVPFVSTADGESAGVQRVDRRGVELKQRLAAADDEPVAGFGRPSRGYGVG